MALKKITGGFSALLFLHVFAYAESTQRLNLEQATVFLSGAELISSARINVTKGENEIIFSNVAGNINNQSITVSTTNGVAVESVTFQNNYTVTDNISPRVREIKDSIDIMNNHRAPVVNKIATLDEQIAVLQNNRKVGGDNTGLSVAELQKMLDLVGNKLEGYLNQKNKEQEILKKIDEHIVALNRQLSEEQKKSYQPGGQLMVKFYSKESTTSNISVSYVVPNAGWTPTYDIIAEDAHSPVKVFYKANIYQNSGVKWDNVHLALSTGNPQEGMQAPTLQPWFLSFYTPPVYQNSVATYKRGKSSKYEESAPAAPYAVDGVQVQGNQSSMNEYVAVDNGGVNTVFDIDIPYTIPSDGQQHLVAVKKYEAPATYEYFTAPKADRDAFMMARITNWQDLNLLSGPTNIFYENTYVGQGYIDAQNTQDTLNISLGRDKKIIVKRERDKKLRSVKTIGTNVHEEFSYIITVRNTRKDAVNITLQDQLPVSNDKDIVLEDKDTGGADYDEATGMLKWTVSLKPNETKVLHFGFSLKYPRGKTITNLPR